MFLIWCSMCMTLLASSRETIKIGLESIYKNQSSVVVSGAGNIEVGEFDEKGFFSKGNLGTSKITISKAKGTYYDLGMSFSSYEAAKSEATIMDIKTVVGMSADGDFRLYADLLSEQEAVKGDLVEVYNEMQECILVLPKKTETVFASHDSDKNMYLTKVGSTNTYRGAIGIGGDSGITPFNEVIIEEYLYGVLPKEMSYAFPEEALKAQAVAARSIALYQYDRYTKSGYNVTDTTYTQVYGGFNCEHPKTNLAVDETKGEVIKYKGQLAEAVYFSTSGGMTEAAKDVWGTDVPYLQPVKDTYETEPAMKPWTLDVKMSDIQKALISRGVNIGDIKSIKISKRSESGRVSEFIIYGTLDEYVVKGSNVRTFFGSTPVGSLKSTYFSFYGPIGEGSKDQVEPEVPQADDKIIYAMDEDGIKKVDTSNWSAIDEHGVSSLGNKVAVCDEDGKIQYIEIKTETEDNKEPTGGNPSGLGTEVVSSDFKIYGAGFGHGVGMSQSGAKGMAKAGFDYVDILKHYYTGVQVSK